MGLIWFWQIEHNGSWYWEISNVSARDNNADDVYAYLGGPDDLHSAAWKNLKPGETYRLSQWLWDVCAAGSARQLRR